MSFCKPYSVALGLLVSAAGLAVAQPPPGQPPPAPPANPPPAPPGNPPPPPGPPPPEQYQPAPQEGAHATPYQVQEGPTYTKKEATDEAKTTLEIYGFTMLDSGFDFGHIGNPNWQDVMRPTKLPSSPDEFGDGTRTFAGVRQTRFGVKSTLPTEVGELKTTFEWELFGVGVDEGQTTFRLRHAYGDWGQFRAGQTWSPFMDIDVFPNSIEYWGPNGMAFFRNVQIAWMPIQGKSRVTVAAERPGASADTTGYADRIDLGGVIGQFPMPDISAEGRYDFGWGYVELAGILRYIAWDSNDTTLAVAGKEWGYGGNLSSNLRFDPFVLKLSILAGTAIENYVNDGSTDIGIRDPAVPGVPIDGASLPVLGLVGFIDANWSDHFTSTAGYSMVNIWNSDGQDAASFHRGHYALVNLLYYPTKKLMFGPEFQFGRRVNNLDSFEVNDFKIQFSVRYNYAKTFGGM